jgi:hypothetical protein
MACLSHGDGKRRYPGIRTLCRRHLPAAVHGCCAPLTRAIDHGPSKHKWRLHCRSTYITSRERQESSKGDELGRKRTALLCERHHFLSFSPLRLASSFWYGDTDTPTRALHTPWKSLARPVQLVALLSWSVVTGGCQVRFKVTGLGWRDNRRGDKGNDAPKTDLGNPYTLLGNPYLKFTSQRGGQSEGTRATRVNLSTPAPTYHHHEPMMEMTALPLLMIPSPFGFPLSCQPARAGRVPCRVHSATARRPPAPLVCASKGECHAFSI